jgi:hypothetical protein
VILSSRIAQHEHHTPSPEAITARIAARQHGVVTVAQLLAAGLGRSAISRRVATGRLVRVHTGVYAVGHGALSRQGEFMAAVLGAGRISALSRFSATELYELSRVRAALITVVSSSQRRPAGVDVHRCRHLDPRDLTTYKGIPVTTVHRTIVDLADVVQIPHELTAVIREADFKGWFVEAAIRDVMARVTGRHNLGVVDRAIELYRAGSAGIRSRSELAFFLLARNAGFPEPLVNVQAFGFERDFHWPELKLAVEIDGPGHTRALTRADDRSRDESLRAAGYTVLRFTDADVKFRSADVLTRLRTQVPHDRVP